MNGEVVVIAGVVVLAIGLAAVLLKVARLKRVRVGAVELEDHPLAATGEAPSQRASSGGASGVANVHGNRVCGSIGDITGARIEQPAPKEPGDESA